jgi:hypothetical protein
MLHYESVGQVKPSAVHAIFREIGAIDRVWWRGALGLDASEEGRPAILRGKTALFHAQRIPDGDDVFMAFADAVFILERLADWAKRFRIKWRIRMRDEDWGAVDPTGMTRPLWEQMGKWSARAGVFQSGKLGWAVPEERREELLARYASRKEV